jgi:hypothetical protein
VSIISLAGLKIKQTVGGEGTRGLAKFLAPDMLVGFFLAISTSGARDASLPFRVGIVSAGVVIFTLLAESRKFFFSGGDLEEFYFVRATAMSRAASALGLLVLDLAVAASIFAPVLILSPVGRAYPADLIAWYIVSVFFSVSFCFILLFLVALLPARAANRVLTLLQVAMALCLLAAFQLSARLEVSVDLGRFLGVSTALFTVTFFLFGLFSFSEKLVSKLNQNGYDSQSDLLRAVGRLEIPAFIRSNEERAGFLFFFANLFRNPQFRLSTVGVAGTPVMVAVYWSMQGTGLMRFGFMPGFRTADMVAPIASLTVSGVIVYYFLSQNILSSRDHEAAWQFQTCGGFNVGRFVLGVRKALLLTVHVPVTILVFAVLAIGNPLGVSLLTALTFYLLGHVAISWFSVMQRRFPFSVPFTQLGATETVNLLFMLGFSFLATVLLFFAYGNIGHLLMLNLFAFILVGVLEYFSTAIANKRVKLGA